MSAPGHGVLLLGGTADARRLAASLAEAGVPVTSSLAGGVAAPALPAGDVRIGGFGGASGLAAYLLEARVAAVVDATHPFAARITAHAWEACGLAGVPLLRLQRQGWADRPDAASWRWVDSLDAARGAAEALGGRPFLATGRQSVPAFAAWAGRYVLLRVVEPPDAVPAGWEVLCARGPFAVDDESALLSGRRVDVLIAKDSGGPTAAKLDAAARLGVPVVMVARPRLPAGVQVTDSVADAVAWAAAKAGPAAGAAPHRR